MSSIPTKQIDGDVAVGRNVSIGGKATVRGSATIGHNLKVEGWLDAKNIKGPNKGLFKTAVQLREAYPNPHDGWWALVAEGLTTAQLNNNLGQVYMADGGAWVAQTNADGTKRLGGNPTVDSAEYMESVEQLTGDLEAVKVDVAANAGQIVTIRDTTIPGLQQQITTQASVNETQKGDITQLKKDVAANAGQIVTIRDTTIPELRSTVEAQGKDITKLKSDVSGNTEAILANTSHINDIYGQKGKPDGIAPLDANAKIPAAHLPGYVDDVVEFNAKVSDISVGDESTKKSTDANCMVVFNEDTARFVLAVSTRAAIDKEDWGNVLRPVKYMASPMALADDVEEDDTPNRESIIQNFWQIDDSGVAILDRTAFQYFAKWGDIDNFGEITTAGAKPEGGKVYITTSDNKTYRWSGTTLVAIGNDLALGRTASTAFPGDAGAKLENDLLSLRQRHDTDYEELAEDILTESYRIDGIAILPFHGYVGNENDVMMFESGIYFVGTKKIFAEPGYSGPKYPNDYNTFDRIGTPLHARDNIIFRLNAGLYRYDGERLVEIGAVKIGNVLNVTEEIPLTAGDYYTDLNEETLEHNPLQAVYDKGLARRGMSITFEIKQGEWRTYQFVGSNITKAQFVDKPRENWKENAGGSATGNIINVHEITNNWAYMSRGLAASLVPEQLRKGGRKITFMSAAKHYQTWQYLGVDKEDWNDETYWKPELQGVSFNGAEAQTPDRDGNINLEYKVDVDQSLNEDSHNAVSNEAVVKGLQEVESNIPSGYRFDEATRQLIITDGKGGEQNVVIPGGGGGSTVTPTAIELTINSPMKATIKEGDDYTIDFIWRHYNITTNVDTQYGGRAELIVGGATVARQEVTQGVCSFNVGKWLSVGTNSIRIKITADDGVISNSAYIKLTVVTLTLTSPYSISTLTPQNSVASFRYVLTGSGAKTVHFTLDGKALADDIVNTSGATSVKAIPTSGLSHGSHRLTVQAEREIDGETLSSNILAYDLMVVEEGKTKAIIAVEMNTPEVEQYETIVIPYAVYDPTSTSGKTQIAVSLNGQTLQVATVDGTRHEYHYRAKEYGELKFIFTCRDTAKEVLVKVNPASQQVEAETDALALHLSSSGRTNDADDAAVWQFTSEAGEKTVAEFHNCGFDSQSGWIQDKSGLMALHLEKGAQCYIPYKPFASDCKLVGKTIEIEFMVSNCYDTDATLISCLTGSIGFEIKAQEAYISSALRKRVESKFKQDERIRVGFQIEQVSERRFIYLFLNGKMSGVIQYDTSDYFVQNPAVGITMGHPACELNVYNIRVYDNVLSFRQMVNNYIADMDDTTVMFEKLEANNILNDDASETDIDYEKAVQKIPCITFIGELPKYKGDKKKNTKVVYEDRQHPEYSFTLDQAQNDVQGTSSQYYPRKNWKFKALVPFTMSQTGETVKKYALRGIDGYGNPAAQKAVKTFCLKADFAESSGTHNTGAANFIHEVLTGAGIKTPMQEIDPTVRTTIYGFPVLMFHQESESAPRKFIGKYNFNNDKSTHDTFGFQDIPGFNLGMVNRDDYLVWHGTFAQLQADSKALTAYEDADVLYYLIENGTSDPMTNHLIAYDDEAGQWKDAGEMWRWTPNVQAWTKRDGSVSTRASGILNRVAAGELVENEIECWEFLNNGHPMCLFHKSDYTAKVYGGDIPLWIDTKLCNSDEKGKYAPYWAGAFEPRYPDNSDNNKEYAQGKIPEQLKRVTDWLVSLDLSNPNLTREQKIAKGITFAGKVEGYFGKKMLLAYDILRELMVMSDQGAKNMMWAIIEGKAWLIFYDNDTIWLINNEGRLIFIPYVEPHSKDSLGKFVFNGESSNLWNLIEYSSLQDEKRDLFNAMVSQGGMTYERALLWFNKRQSDQWSETVYNADSKYKYIDSFGVTSEDGSGDPQDYLDIAQGSREEHRKWAMYERFQYMNAKYGTGTYRDSYVALRANTAGESSVPHKVEVTITAAQDWYFGFRFSGNAGYTSEFVKKGESKTFTAPEGSNPNDTECYVHQADRISDLGDLSLLYPTTLQLGNCKMLTRLVVGNKTDGYIGKLANIALAKAEDGGAHPLLKYVNVCNIPTLQSTLDLKACSALEEIEAQGSRITGVDLPKGSTVERMHLPETLIQLKFDSLTNLTNRNLIIDGYGEVQTIDIVNCAKLNPMEIVDMVTSTEGSKLQYIRVTGVTLRGTGEELIRLIDLGVHGASDNGKTGKPEIIGTYEIEKLPTTAMVERIEDGISGITLVIVVEAFVNTIEEVNAESASGTPEVEEVTLDNIDEHIRYYNGETAEEALQRFARENRSIHDIIYL